MKKQTHTFNVVRKALQLELKQIKDNLRFIVWHCNATHSQNHIYRIIYNKDFDEMNCDCQAFKYRGKCSHTLKAWRLITPQEEFYNNIEIK